MVLFPKSKHSKICTKHQPVARIESMGMARFHGRRRVICDLEACQVDFWDERTSNKGWVLLSTYEDNHQTWSYRRISQMHLNSLQCVYAQKKAVVFDLSYEPVVSRDARKKQAILRRPAHHRPSFLDVSWHVDQKRMSYIDFWECWSCI